MQNDHYYLDQFGNPVISKRNYRLALAGLGLISVLFVDGVIEARLTQRMAVAHAKQREELARQAEEGFTLSIPTTTVLRVGGSPEWLPMGRKSTVTAYTSRVEETDATPCISADGSDICKRYARGEKICASNDYKMGTRLSIEGLGTCTVRDRMATRYTGTGRVDWYNGYDLKGAREIGARSRMVTVVK